MHLISLHIISTEVLKSMAPCNFFESWWNIVVAKPAYCVQRTLVKISSMPVANISPLATQRTLVKITNEKMCG